MKQNRNCSLIEYESISAIHEIMKRKCKLKWRTWNPELANLSSTQKTNSSLKQTKICSLNPSKTNSVFALKPQSIPHNFEIEILQCSWFWSYKTRTRLARVTRIVHSSFDFGARVSQTIWGLGFLKQFCFQKFSLSIPASKHFWFFNFKPAKLKIWLTAFFFYFRSSPITK